MKVTTTTGDFVKIEVENITKRNIKGIMNRFNKRVDKLVNRGFNTFIGGLAESTPEELVKMGFGEAWLIRAKNTREAKR